MENGAVHKFLANETCQALTQLVHEMAAIDSARPFPSRVAGRLEALAHRDTVFRQWAMTNICCDDVSSACQVLAANLPGHLIGFRKPPLPIADELAGQNMLSAAHLTLRLKAMERTHEATRVSHQHAALYNFAYGLSHELNNPLANISTRAGVLAQEETDAARRSMLEAIVEHAMRGCEMLGDLMLIARPPQVELTSVSVSSFFDEFVEHARRWAARYAIEINPYINYSGEFTADATAMREALWCLVRNSIEAIDRGGEIDILVGQTNDDHIKIEIRDNGPGLSPEALEHCFDPFFCGREAGRGLGVGLSKARRIVELHRGRVQLHNIPGGGCAAVVEIPA